MTRQTSLYLDIIRPIAALVVLLSHASMKNLSGGQLGFMASSGVQAVDAFFVLSGFVIAHVCITKEKDVTSYFIGRAARIYSVAIPALILTVMLDAIGMKEDAATYQGAFQTFSLRLFIRSIFFIGEMWDSHQFPGSDGPYWSLGFEVWYYIAFGAFFFVPGRWRWLATAAVLAFIGPKVALMFPAWLAGVASYYFCSKQRLSKSMGWFVFALSFVMLAGYQMAPHSPLQQFTSVSFSTAKLASTAQDYFLALLFSMNIVGFVAVSNSFGYLLDLHAKLIRWLAGGTFSIYLMHLPIMHLLSAISPWPKSSAWTLMLLLVVTPVACMTFAEASERRKDIWRRLILTFSRKKSFSGGEHRVVR